MKSKLATEFSYCKSRFGATSASGAWIFDLSQPEQQTVDYSPTEIDVALNDFPGSAEIAAGREKIRIGMMCLRL